MEGLSRYAGRLVLNRGVDHIPATGLARILRDI